MEGLDNIKEAYLQMDKELELVPQEGVYAVPYVANAAGVLYNKDIFDQYGWEILPPGMSLWNCARILRQRAFSLSTSIP